MDASHWISGIGQLGNLLLMWGIVKLKRMFSRFQWLSEWQAAVLFDAQLMRDAFAGINLTTSRCLKLLVTLHGALITKVTDSFFECPYQMPMINASFTE